MLALLHPAGRQIGRRAADRDIAVRQPRAANFFEQVENLLAFAEGIQEGTECSQVQAIRPHAHQVAGNAVQLDNHHAQMTRFGGQLQVEQLFHDQRPAEIHVHAGQVIHPIGVRNPLSRSEVLADLFGAAVQIADVGRDFGDHLAVGPQHQPQHAVRAGMLRAHVDQHLVGSNIELNDARIVGLRRHIR